MHRAALSSQFLIRDTHKNTSEKNEAGFISVMGFNTLYTAGFASSIR